MSESLANITQIFNQSPQVSTLVGGHQAAVEAGLRKDQADKAKTYEQELNKTVLAPEKSQKTGKIDIKEEKKGARKRKMEGRARPVKKSKGGVPSKDDNRASEGGVQPVIDICI